MSKSFAVVELPARLPTQRGVPAIVGAATDAALCAAKASVKDGGGGCLAHFQLDDARFLLEPEPSQVVEALADRHVVRRRHGRRLARVIVDPRCHDNVGSLLHLQRLGSSAVARGKP